VGQKSLAKKSYHHGNLKQALVDASIILIEQKGPMGFTMAEAAKTAGVSAAAPYRHFEGREDLIREIARQGFEIFADLMEFAYAKEKTPLASFESVGRAYLAFARKYPGNYIAMFESNISINASADLAAVANRGFDTLSKAAEELSEHLPVHKRPPPMMISQHIWAMSHGIVELFARGEPGARSPYTPEELLESGTGIYLRGLGILPADE
jgi:AcrR family transcriptional regulator